MKWKTEPDFWLGEGMMAFRHPQHGHWCAYVAIPKSHPWMQVSDCWDIPANVHGGITWAEAELPNQVRDLVGPDFYADFSWVGFDCAHALDYMPFYKHNTTGSKYKDLEFVKAEILRLAGQVMRTRRESV